MTADYNAWCANAPFSIREDAQPSRNGAFATMVTQSHFAQGIGGGKALNKHDCGHTIIAC